MIKSFVGILVILTTLVAFNSNSAEPTFDMKKDLLLLNFDLKTDVDDVHTIAALDLILQADEFKNLNYYAVSGTYGVQAGLFVPANELFNKVFKARWTDLHNERKVAINNTVKAVTRVLSNGGKIWVMEAGQSDFTQTLLLALIEKGVKYTKKQFITVQHSDWNENETSVNALNYVKSNTTYIRIADGNKEGNGTPGFNNASYSAKSLESKNLLSSKTWMLANKISTKYNGINGRYDNKAISGGGVDFSDLAEVTYILDIKNTPTVAAFFSLFNKTISEE
ncbi:hypothetical protein ACOYR1_07100 [Thalassotalea piscium]